MENQMEPLEKAHDLGQLLRGVQKCQECTLFYYEVSSQHF